jgi:hypothetical protein
MGRNCTRTRSPNPWPTTSQRRVGVSTLWTWTLSQEGSIQTDGDDAPRLCVRNGSWDGLAAVQSARSWCSRQARRCYLAHRPDAGGGCPGHRLATTGYEGLDNQRKELRKERRKRLPLLWGRSRSRPESHSNESVPAVVSDEELPGRLQNSDASALNSLFERFGAHTLGWVQSPSYPFPLKFYIRQTITCFGLSAPSDVSPGNGDLYHCSEKIICPIRPCWAECTSI